MKRTELQEDQSQDITALQVEIALLRRRLEDAEKSEWAAKEAYRQLEVMHRPTNDDEAFQRLGDAFATFEELRDYTTSRFYNATVEALVNLENEVEWQRKPHLIRKVLPALLEEDAAIESAVQIYKQTNPVG